MNSGHQRELSLVGAGLERLPEGLWDLSESLEVLDLSGNLLSELPEDFARLSRLRVLFLSQNRFEVVPEVLARLPELEMIGFKGNRIAHLPPRALPPRTRWLILTDNLLEELPESLGNLPRLQKLMLAGNRLRRLPASLSRLGNLELVRLAANRLDEFPDSLLSLPRLAWLALSGNPCCPSPFQEKVEMVDWSRLELLETLGQGASGVISRCRLTNPDSTSREVALKLFKGAMTSDGLPEEEMSVCLAAGKHPNLVPLVGRLAGHPEGRAGLVMELIPPHFRVLGGTPSRASCTRDVYPEGTAFSLTFAWRVLAGIADLVAHLHNVGICHGDLYAHNILVDDDGHALLGDFGAAGFVAGLGESRALGMCRLEARAFGCLCDDLLSRVASAELATEVGQELLRVREVCLGEVPALRPELSEVAVRLHRSPPTTI